MGRPLLENSQGLRIMGLASSINQRRLLPFLAAEIVDDPPRGTVDWRITMLISVLLKKQCTETRREYRLRMQKPPGKRAV